MTIAMFVCGIVYLIITIIGFILEGPTGLFTGAAVVMIFFGLGTLLYRQEELRQKYEEQNKPLPKRLSFKTNCPKCGKKFDAEMNSCPYCGHRTQA